MMDWRTLVAVGAVLAVLLLLFGLNKTLPRQRFRRSLVLYPAYAALVLVHRFTGFYATERWYDILGLVGALLGVLLLINLAAIVVFDVLLPLTKLRYPDILRDLSVGAAYILAGVWLMHHAGVNLASIVATSAVVTAVIGLSLQSTLGSIIGGLALQVDDTINEGDWIELENKTQGLVKKVRWRHTVIETRDWDTLLVPNNQLLNQTVKILGRREGKPIQHRMWVYFNIDFRFTPADVVRAVDGALQGAPIKGVAADPPAHTICFDLAREGRDSVALYAVRYYLTDLAADDPTSSLVRERIHAALARAQIPLAMPAMALFVSNETQEWRERKVEQKRSSAFSALRGVELFKSLSDDELFELAKAVKPAPFVAGELVTRQGGKAHWLYVLTEGVVNVTANRNGADIHVARLEAPSFFGEMALMTGAAREATVTAATDVSCLRVDREDFSALLKRRPEIASEISLILAERRVALDTALVGIESDRQKKMQTERGRILESIRDFFAL